PRGHRGRRRRGRLRHRGFAGADGTDRGVRPAARLPRPPRRVSVDWPRLARSVAYPLLGAALFVAAWWGWVALFIEPTSFLAQFAPDRAARALVDLVAGGDLNRHVVASLRRILVGLTVATAI